MTPIEQQHRFRVITAFLLVYVLWGSTYLAMRVVVRDIPPYVVGGVRYIIAGPLMLAVCALLGRKISITRKDALRLLVIGVLLLSVGNIAVLWAEEYVPSGLAALVVAIVPIWVAVIEAWIFRSARLPARGLIGLALGIGGLVLLLWPQISSKTHLGRQELFGVGILAFGSLAWALGSVFSSRWTLSVDVFVSAAWQMTLGGLVNTVIALAAGEFTRARWSVSAITGIVYLIICGSWIGFTAYIWLLEHVPTPKVATYAYVNPIIAVFLGWWLLNEKVGGFTLVGTAVIVAGVALVNGSKLRRNKTISDSEPESVQISAAGAAAD